MKLASLLLISLLYGPYQARISSVAGAATLKLNVSVWPGQTNHIVLRVADVETPRLRGECETERLLAREAMEFTRSFVGKSVTLEKLKRSSRSGYTARVKNNRGDDLKQALISAGYGAEPDAEKKTGWCPE